MYMENADLGKHSLQLNKLGEGGCFKNDVTYLSQQPKAFPQCRNPHNFPCISAFQNRYLKLKSSKCIRYCLLAKENLFRFLKLSLLNCN